MTTRLENPTGGRDRGFRGLSRAWVEVLVRPVRFFRTGISPGEQALGLTFAIAVAVAFVAGWLLAAPGAVPAVTESRALSVLVMVLAVGLLAAPAGLHLTAAIAVVAVAALVDDRAGVSETVQVVAYATAPMALAGPPVPALRVVCAAYGTVLLAYGLRTINDTSWPRAALAALTPALLGFGVGYRAIAAGRTLFGF